MYTILLDCFLEELIDSYEYMKKNGIYCQLQRKLDNVDEVLFVASEKKSLKNMVLELWDEPDFIDDIKFIKKV